MKTIIIESYTVYVGQTKKENWELLDESNASDIFFHLRSFPSGYVIMKSKEGDVPSQKVLNQCAQLCKQHTKYKRMSSLYVDYTPCDNLIKGNNVGEVIYKSNRKVNKLWC